MISLDILNNKWLSSEEEQSEIPCVEVRFVEPVTHLLHHSILYFYMKR